MKGQGVMARETIQEMADMLLYFWEEKGDFSRYVDYEIFKEQYPKEAEHLLLLWEQHRAAEMMISNYLKILIERGNNGI